MTTTPDFRALCAEMLAALEVEAYAPWVIDPEDYPLFERARAALATPPPETPTELPVLPPGYIDSEHTGQDREILDAFYRACNLALTQETTDKINLRGIHAVLKRWG